MFSRGDRINLKDGAEAVITGWGSGDFFGDPYPVYYTVIRNGTEHSIGETGHVFSTELKSTKG